MKLCNTEVGADQPIFLIAGPDSLESVDMCVEVAGHVAEIARELGMLYVFKGSFDKANRTSHTSYRGPGIEAGLKMLAAVREQVGVPVLTDIHEIGHIPEVASVVDVLQTPAFLCRQTDFIEAAARSGRPVNIKKGQFLSPWEMTQVIAKAESAGCEQSMICERGFSFGYNNLVVDMRGLAVMRSTGRPVVFDATHSVQLPGGQGGSSGGQREHIAVLSRAAVGAGVSGLFMETHPQPDKALCDGPNSLPLAKMRELLEMLWALDRVVKSQPYLELNI